jgi:NADH-quinone oxidoreductase subunit N
MHFFSFFASTLILSIGLCSIFTGIRGAYTEKLIKRFFVYSSIGHVGFILIGLALNTFEGYFSIFVYILVYILSSFIMWFFLLSLGRAKPYISSFSEIKLKDPILIIIFAFLILFLKA